MGVRYYNRVVFVCDQCEEEFETTGTSYLTPPDWVSFGSQPNEPLWFCSQLHLVEYLSK